MNITLFPASQILIKQGTWVPKEDQQSSTYGRLAGNEQAMRHYDSAKRDFERYQQKGYYDKPQGQIGQEALQARNSWNAAQRMRTGESQYDPRIFGAGPAPDMSNYQGPSYWDMYADQWRRLGNVPHYLGLTNQEAFPLHYRNEPLLDVGAAVTGGGLATLAAAGGVAAAPLLAGGATATTTAGAATAAVPLAVAAATPTGQNLMQRASTMLPNAWNWMSNLAMRAGPNVQQALNSPLTRSRVDPMTMNTMARSGLHNMATIARDFSVPGASFSGSGPALTTTMNAVRTGQLGQIPYADLAMRGFSSYMAAENMRHAYNQGMSQAEITGSPVEGVLQAGKSWASGIPVSPIPPAAFMGAMALDIGNDVASPSILQPTSAGMMIPQATNADYDASYINSLLQSANPTDRAQGMQLVANRDASTRPIGSRVDSVTNALMYDFKKPVFDYLGLSKPSGEQISDNAQLGLNSYNANLPFSPEKTPTSHIESILLQGGMTPDQAARMAPAYLVSGLMSEANTAMQGSVYGPTRGTPAAQAMGQNASNYQNALQAFVQVAQGQLSPDIFNQAMHEFMQYRQTGFNSPVPDSLRFDLMLQDVQAQSNQGQASSEPKPAGAL